MRCNVCTCAMYVPYNFSLYFDLICSRCELQGIEHLAIAIVPLGDGDDHRGPCPAPETALIEWSERSGEMQGQESRRVSRQWRNSGS